MTHETFLLSVIVALTIIGGFLCGVVLCLREDLREARHDLRLARGRLWAACEALRIRGFSVDAQELDA